MAVERPAETQLNRTKHSADKAKRKALRALEKARRAVEASGVKLSDWEGEFLGSVEGRVEKYGRAFRDFEKGGPDSSLSLLQTVKLKEIIGKAAGKPDKKRFGQRKRPSFVK